MISDIVARVPANDIERIIKSSAVLPEIKASIVAQRSKSARPKEFFGWLGLIAGIAGSLLGFAEDQLFRLSIIALFGLGVINCLVIRRYRSGIRWLVNGIIFIIGFYVYGHWGILIGFGIAYLISVLIIRPSVDDNSNSNI